MKLAARIAMVGCWMALVGCGAENAANTEGAVDSTSSAITCPNITPPNDNFCPTGTIQPVYDGKCIVGYKCVESTVSAQSLGCPNIAQPTDKFCPNGTIQAVYDGGCLVGYKCI